MGRGGGAESSPTNSAEAAAAEAAQENDETFLRENSLRRVLDARRHHLSRLLGDLHAHRLSHVRNLLARLDLRVHLDVKRLFVLSCRVRLLS